MEEEDKKKRTNPKNQMTFVNISFDVPHPKDQKPLNVWPEKVCKSLRILMEDGDERAALTTYATMDYTMIVEDPGKMPTKLTKLRKYFKTV